MSNLTLFSYNDDFNVDNCCYPEKPAATAYRYGCRCNRCRSDRASAFRRTADKRCTVEKCESERLARQPWCSEHAPLSRCKIDGCEAPKVAGSGNRYCEHHKQMGWVQLRMRTHHCVRCNNEYTRMSNEVGLCDMCQRTHGFVYARMRRHNVSRETQVAVLRAKTVSCQLCDRSLYVGKGKNDKQSFVIDHDHNCCPGAHSCGKCVRGFLCNACNVRLGFYEALIETVGALGVEAYLKQRM